MNLLVLFVTSAPKYVPRPCRCQNLGDLPRTSASIQKNFRTQVSESCGLTEDRVSESGGHPRTGARMQGTYQERVPCKTPEVHSYRGQLPESGALTEDGCQNPEVHSYRGHLPESGALTEDGCQNPEHSPRTGGRTQRSTLTEDICQNPEHSPRTGAKTRRFSRAVLSLRLTRTARSPTTSPGLIGSIY